MGSRSLRIVVSIGVLISLLAEPLSAPVSAQVPPALDQWRDWVLYGEEYRNCPLRNGADPGQRAGYVCAWPGELRLSADLQGAQFSLDWTVYDDSWVALPGNTLLWPQDVRVDGVPQAAVERDGRPNVRLEAGTHRVTGRLRWQTRPASVDVPEMLGLVELVVDGVVVPAPDLANGSLWLGLRDDDAEDQDRLSVEVYRLLSDGIPIRLETRIELRVSGQGRELALPDALPIGFVGEALRSELTARLDPNGTLSLQLRPGEWLIELYSHAATFVDNVTLPEREAPWPAAEIWSYQAAPHLRISALEGAESVDADQAGVPSPWRGNPAFRVTGGQAVMLAERSRNEAQDPNRLGLGRDMWLDFDGDAYTVLDRVTGRMGNRWRLDMAVPYVMTMAAADGAPLLVTTGPEAGTQGVELRALAPSLRATGRVAAERSLAVSGYAERFDSVATMLHLPPGYRLIAAAGADRATNAWIERWRLLDLFLLLIISAAVGRLLGVKAGVLALVTLVFIFHEPWAPRWTWLNALVAMALVTVLPTGRFKGFAVRYKWLSLALVALWLVPFSIAQLRLVIYPQLEQTALGTGYSESRDSLLGRAASGRLDSQLVRVEREQDRAAAVPLEEVLVTATRAERVPLTRYAPGALVQTGPGLPDWSWNQYRLSWSGPVEAGQTFSLYLFSPWQTAVWRALGVVLALALLGVLIQPGLKRLPRVFERNRSVASVLAVVVLSLGFAVPEVARAQASGEFPSASLLDELKARLLRPAPCHPSCAALDAANVSINATTLTLQLRYALQDDVAVPLATTNESWRPTQIRVDGNAFGMLHWSGDTPWIHLDAGVHEVVVGGPVPVADSFTLSFPLVPHAAQVTVEGWQVAGLNEGRLPSGGLELVRQREAPGDTELPAATVFPPFVHVSRNVSFDLEWQVVTEVARIAPSVGAFTLEIPILPGESVLSAGVTVVGDRVLAAFGPTQQFVTWTSSLPLGDRLELNAPLDVPWSESWRFTVSPIWHAELAGVPAVPINPSATGFYVPEHYPRPGEALTVSLSRPQAASGDTIAIDRVDYDLSVGERSTSSSLDFTYRSTQGGPHALTLPAGSELTAVEIDGDTVPLQLDGNALEIQKTPGEHRVVVEWRNADPVGFRSVVPTVDLGGGASNIYVSTSLPADRWVLFTYGPTLGPAILYWSELVIFVIAAFVLGRLKFSPLRTHEWLLVGLGLSTFAWEVLLLFAAWAFVLKWREHAELKLTRVWFNLLQVALAAFSIGALSALVSAIPAGLLGQPNMHISSPVSFGSLSWFLDRTDGATPSIGVISVSLWLYKAAMLAWSLWLSFALLRWLRWAWAAYSANGVWRGRLGGTAG